MSKTLYRPIQHVALGKHLDTSHAASSWQAFSNFVSEKSEITTVEATATSVWEKSRWCISEKYDELIKDAVYEGYDRYDDLPEDLQYALVLEILKTEKSCIFSDADQDSELADCIVQIMLTRGEPFSFDALYEHLVTHFIHGRSNKPAYFADTINGALADQMQANHAALEQESLYGDPDDIDDDYYQSFQEVAHG